VNHVAVKRPRVLAAGGDGALWVAGDGAAEAPWSRGPGEIWRVRRRRAAGARAAWSGRRGHRSRAERRSLRRRSPDPEIFAVGADGRRVTFAKFTDSDAPRSLAFAPVTPETERAGIAGSLFVVTINRGAWPVNEILKISGPFERVLREGAPRP
jgi:hypothetical protein